MRSLDPGYQALYGELVEQLEWADPYGHPRLRGEPADGFREEVERSAHRPWAEEPVAYFAAVRRFLTACQPFGTA